MGPSTMLNSLYSVSLERPDVAVFSHSSEQCCRHTARIEKDTYSFLYNLWQPFPPVTGTWTSCFLSFSQCHNSAFSKSSWAWFTTSHIPPVSNSRCNLLNVLFKCSTSGWSWAPQVQSDWSWTTFLPFLRSKPPFCQSSDILAFCCFSLTQCDPL